MKNKYTYDLKIYVLSKKHHKYIRIFSHTGSAEDIAKTKADWLKQFETEQNWSGISFTETLTKVPSRDLGV